MKFIFIFFLIISLFLFHYCLFENSKYVKLLNNIEEFDISLNKTNITIGMMLIFSLHCGYCHTFSETYEKLAKKYNNSMLFFAMSVYTNYYKRMPSAYGVPYILFFSDGYFYQHKRRRSFEELSYTIDNFYLTRCREITYKNIANVYYNVFLKNKNKYNNLVIGYFDDASNNDIENFKKSTNLMCPECIGLCYICKDYKHNNDKNNTFLKYIEKSTIVGYLHNNLKFFLWENKIDKKDINGEEIEKYKNIAKSNNINLDNFDILLYKNYDEFINKDLKLEYIDIDNKNKEYLINFLRNKKNLIFGYINNNEKEIYINNINELLNITDKNILSIYNLVLYSFKEIQNKNLSFITMNHIYEIDQELNLINEYKNYQEIKNKIINEYNKDKEKYEINYKPIIPDVNKDVKNSFENQIPEVNDSFEVELFFKILEKVCVVLFTIVVTFAVFFAIHHKYYSNINMKDISLIKRRIRKKF